MLMIALGSGIFALIQQARARRGITPAAMRESGLPKSLPIADASREPLNENEAVKRKAVGKIAKGEMTVDGKAVSFSVVDTTFAWAWTDQVSIRHALEYREMLGRFLSWSTTARATRPMSFKKPLGQIGAVKYFFAWDGKGALFVAGRPILYPNQTNELDADSASILVRLMDELPGVSAEVDAKIAKRDQQMAQFR